MRAITRYLHEYLRPGTYGVLREESHYHRGDELLECTVYHLPRRRPRPAWLVLHGLTYVGRKHPSLERFARALSASGTVVMVPDLPEWRSLRVATAITIPTIRTALRELAGRPEVDPSRIGVIGFSFGATQALVAVSDPSLASTCRGIAAWGGFRDVHRAFEFGLTGHHELDGVHYQMDPDPYGSWIIAGNYLTGIPGYEDYEDVASALFELALEAGRRRTFAWDPGYDPDKARLRQTVRPEHREVFDTFARPAGQKLKNAELATSLAHGLADSAIRAEPLLDPGPFLPRLAVRTILAHGRDDRLIPFTESLRLARDLPAGILAGCRVTGLFAHAGGTQHGLGMRFPPEVFRFIRTMDAIIRFV